LNYLKGLSVHTLKIDRSFVEQIATPSGTLPLIHTIVILAHNLGLRTVAEGVETNEQWEMLRAARCDAMQGFLFGKALDADAFSRVLADAAEAPFGQA
jgi:EAL domain-containing protein (putative c-di-GMP-specific phosphodiesterase class I)